MSGAGREREVGVRPAVAARVAAAFRAVLFGVLCLAAAGAATTDPAQAEPLGIASFAAQTTVSRQVEGAGGAPAPAIEQPYVFAQAGGHPDGFTTTVEFDSEAAGPDALTPTGDARDVVLDLPPGLTASPQAVAPCPLAQAGTLGREPCPIDSQVGVYEIHTSEGIRAGPIVELTPEPGALAELGLETSIANYSFLITVRAVATSQGYRLRMIASGLLALGIISIETTLWGVPAAASHDPQRGLFCDAIGQAAPWRCEGGGISAGVAPAPFLTIPADCAAGPLSMGVQADSWEQPGLWAQASATLPAAGDCGLLQFAPEVQVKPDTTLADAPLGLGMDLESPQQQATQGSATPPLRQASVTLPQGVSLSPTVGDGLQACPATGPEGIDMPAGLSASDAPRSPEEAGEGEAIAPDGLSRLAPGHCPKASTVGIVEASTPLLSSAVMGRVYLAQPLCGGGGQPACTEADAADGRLLRIYVELGGAGASIGDRTGLVLKLEGEIDVDPATGQLTVVIGEAPQMPIGALRIELGGGPDALLAGPSVCGRASTTARLTAWSAPGSASEGAFVAGTPDALSSSSYEVEGCQSAPVFNPGFIAGTLDPQAGAFSPLTVTATRADREPYLSRLQVHLPGGVSAKLAGVALCGDAAASAGDCPAASRVGGAIVAAGAGSHPLQIQGEVYLTTGYQGAPLGLAIVLDAVAGPLHLGVVVVRARIDVNATTGAITITSDQLPRMLLGVPLRLRRISLEIDRQGFILNPTDCAAAEVIGAVEAAPSPTPVVARPSYPFAVGGCSRLPFRPKLAAATRGDGRFGGHGAGLALTISVGAGQANLRSVTLSLPRRLPARGPTLAHACTEETFQSEPSACPAASAVGYARVQTAILSSPMLGPVYLVAKARGARDAFPSIVVVLQADGLRIDLTGQMYVTVKNVTSATFSSIPDIPIHRLQLVLPEGRRSLLSAGASLCKSRGRLRMRSTITGQNGAVVNRVVPVAVSGCRGRGRRTRHRR